MTKSHASELETRIVKARSALGDLSREIHAGVDHAIIVARILKIGAELVELALNQAPKVARKEESR